MAELAAAFDVNAVDRANAAASSEAEARNSHDEDVCCTHVCPDPLLSLPPATLSGLQAFRQAVLASWSERVGCATVARPEDQNLDLQRNALRKAGCQKIFEEKELGRAGTKRPAFEAALAFLHPEDQLVVWKVDRLGRSLREMINTAHDLQQQGVKNVDTETPTGRLMFNFLGTIAEYFLDLNRERTIEGLKAALARGCKGGRRRKLSEADQAVARAMLKDLTIPVAAIAKRLGVSRATFYAYFPGARRRPSLTGGSPMILHAPCPPCRHLTRYPLHRAHPG